MLTGNNQFTITFCDHFHFLNRLMIGFTIRGWLGFYDHSVPVGFTMIGFIFIF